LIQLINDQVGNLEEKYGVKAHFVTSFSNPTAAADLSSVLSNRNNNDAIQVLIVTPETFASKEFQSWYKPFEARDRSQQNRFLEAIAVDEVHSILSCSDDFRSEYAEIISYIGVNVPIAMLSGSLTIKYEIELLIKIESRCNDSLDLIRLPMNSANIFNHIVLVEENFKKELSWLVVLMEYFSSDPSQFSVSIIYFNSIDTMSKVFEWFYHASPLGFQDRIFKFYSNSVDENYRSEITRVFLKSDIYKVGFATSSLGQGIDKSNIRIQISWGAPREIDHYIQAFGRAGRDGKPSISILYAFKKQLNKKELSDQMALLVNSNDCRRKTILSEFHNTISLTEAHELESCCDFCAYNTSLSDEQTNIQRTIQIIVGNYSALKKATPKKNKDSWIINEKEEFVNLLYLVLEEDDNFQFISLSL